MARVMILQQKSKVDTAYNVSHQLLLSQIWEATGLTEDDEFAFGVKEETKWDILGLEVVEGMGGKRVVWREGQLGLDYLVRSS